MIVQSPNQRSQNEAIPAGLGKPSIGTRPPTPMGMPKPRPVRPPVLTEKPRPPRQPPINPDRMRNSFSPMGGMTNPLAGAIRPIAKNFAGQPGSWSRSSNGMPTPTQQVQTMEAEVVTPQQGFENQGGFDSPVSAGRPNDVGYGGYDQRYDDPSFYMTPDFIAAERERDPAQINSHLEARRNYFQGGVEGFTPTAQFDTLDKWDQWRRGRGAFLG